MDRRRFLRAGGLAFVAGLAGCSGGGDGPAGATPSGNDGTDTETAPATTPGSGPGDATTAAETATAPETTVETGPEGIYVQSFRERMAMQGTATTGDYGFALMFTVPHTFWTVTGDTVSVVERTPEDSLHLMASVWDPESRTVLPETGLSVELTRDGEVVSQEVIYPMLSQPMGFHYGGNFTLDGDGTYTATVSVGGTNIRRAGGFAGRFDDPASVELPLEFTPETREEVTSMPIDQGGQPGALRPMEMLSTPKGQLPAPGQLPGTVRGSVLADGGRFVVTTLEDFDDDGPYLAVSARTRYNGYVLPAMALSATLERDGETVYDGRLERTLSPDLGYHYGAPVEATPGDELTLEVTTPPQVARHEGYETALTAFGEPTLTL